MKNQKECSRSILTRKLEEFLAQGKNKFYLRDVIEETRIPLVDIEDFFLPLLREDGIEGSLEVRCPNCGADLGSFKKYPEIPQELCCELCGTEFPRADEYLEIVLEIKGKFFRAQEKLLEDNRKETDQARTG